MEFKLTIADPKTGKCVQKSVEGDAAKRFVGLKIGDNVKGEALDLKGYEFEITGGSDFCGFPMRKGIQGARKRVLIGKGIGFRGGKTKKVKGKKKYLVVKGMRKRKYIRGNTVSEEIAQINCKIVEGEGDVALMLGLKQEEAPAETTEQPTEEKKEETPKEQPAEAPKEEVKEEAPTEEPKEDKPEEENKE